MKKRFRTRVCSVVLTLAMALSLAACSRGNNNSDPTGQPGNKQDASANSQLAKQYVFSYKELELNKGDDYYIMNTALNADKMYLTLNSYSNEDGNYVRQLSVISMNKDGSDIQEIELQQQGDVSGEPQEGADTVPEDNEDAVPEDDEDAATEDDEDADTEDNEDAASEDDEDTDPDDVEDWDVDYEVEESYEYDNYNSSIVTKDGFVYALRSHTKEDYSDPDNYIYEENYYLSCWDLEGNAKWEVPLNKEEENWFNNLVDLQDGSVAIIVSGEKWGKIIADKDGNLSGFQPFSGDGSRFQNYNNMIITGDGKAILSYYANDNWEKQYLCEIDIKTGEMGEQIELPPTMSYNGFYNVYAGVNTDFVYGSNDGIYTYNMGDEASVKIMDYVNSDINIGNISSIAMVDDEHFIGVYNDAIDWTTKTAVFTKVNPEDIKDKQILMLGGNYVSSDSTLMKRVIDFNKSSDSHRIVVKDYSSYNTSEDYMAGFTQLNNDIISGNMPDILRMSTDMSIDSYVSKGILADIDELIAKDEELSKVEFMQNVFDAYRLDGKLYQVIPSFRVQTYIAKSSLVGDRKGWTMQEFKDIVASLPEGTSIFGETTRDSFLNDIMNYCGNDFVDVNTGKCSFDSPLFIELLEMANSYPEEINYEDESYGEDWWMNYQSQYRDNRTLLKSMYISSLRWVKEDINGSMGEDISYVGFPTESGEGGSVLMATENFALSAKSANLEGAWNFVRYYLTEEYQTGDEFWGLSVHKKILEDSKKLAMEKSYYTDENGEKIEYDDTIYINGEEIVYEPLNQQQADELFDFICSVKKREYYNEDVLKIVTEEAEAFFSGQKSAADVAGLIQNRVQLYINENR